jgi:hypothetical protein
VADPPTEDLDQRLHVGEGVARQVMDDVELLGADHLAQLLVVGPVGVEPADRARQPGLTLASVEHRDVVAPLDQLLHEREPVEPGTAHHQDLHRRTSAFLLVILNAPAKNSYTIVVTHEAF